MSELLEYTFFRHALVGALLVSVLCGMVGTYVVTRRQVFVGGGIAHASLGGVGMGAFFGFSPLLGASLFALGSGYAIRWLSRRREIREDSAIAMLWTFGMSAGILCSYLSSDFMPELPSFLFGNILTVTSTDLYLLGGLTFFTACCFTMLQRPIAMVAFDYEFARSQRIPASAIELLMIGLTALTIVGCLRMVGIVLVISMLSVPQLTANLFTQNFKRLILYSIVFGFVGCMGGLTIAYHYNVPGGASIIFVSILIYLLAKAIKSAIQCLYSK